jgi:hypothetical protein
MPIGDSTSSPDREARPAELGLFPNPRKISRTGMCIRV